MARTNRMQFVTDFGKIVKSGNERTAAKRRKDYRKGEPKTLKISLGRLRRDIRGDEAWNID